MNSSASTPRCARSSGSYEGMPQDRGLKTSPWPRSPFGEDPPSRPACRATIAPRSRSRAWATGRSSAASGSGRRPARSRAIRSASILPYGVAAGRYPSLGRGARLVTPRDVVGRSLPVSGVPIPGIQGDSRFFPGFGMLRTTRAEGRAQRCPRAGARVRRRSGAVPRRARPRPAPCAGAPHAR
jgi:hypothetical protein